MIQSEPRIATRLDFDKSFYKELRKIMFRHGLSVQEYFSYLIQLTVTGDQRIHDLLMEAKKNSATNISGSSQEIVNTDSESLFNLIEESSPFYTKG
jgi:hypothetical protein